MRRFFNIHQMLHLFAPYGAPIGVSLFIFVNLNPHFPKMFPTKFGWNQFSGFGEGKVYAGHQTSDDGRAVINIAHLS